jgi:hypothetical protein
MIFVGAGWAKDHHDVSVMVVQLGDDAHGCAGGGRERGGDRSGGGQLFGPPCGLDCREGPQTSKDRVDEVDATTACGRLLPAAAT